MKIFAKVLGTVEVLIALFAAFLAVSMTAGFFGDDKFAGEWGAFLIPLDLVVAAAFGWSGFNLLRQDSGRWMHQLIPLIAVTLIVAFIIWVDSG